MFTNRRYISRVLCLLILGALGGAAQADLIVDTGQPGSALDGGWTLYQSHWVAGEFSLGQATTITGIEAWIWDFIPGDVTVILFGDGGNVPDDATQLFSTTFSFDGVSESGGAAWQGVQGLAWDVAPGTYWAGFEVSSSSTAWGGLPTGEPAPLSGYAYRPGAPWSWYPLQSGWGLRVYGSPDGSTQDQNVVPEPATMTLCGLGLFGLAGRAYRRHRHS